ncbi:MAG: hypothetical protein ABL860_05840 [Candidatus Nitrotoga sp.]
MNFTLNQQGSAMISGMILVAMISFVAMGVTSFSTNMTATARTQRIQATASRIAALFSSLGQNNTLCQATIVSSGAFNPVTALPANGGQAMQVCMPSLENTGSDDGLCNNANDRYPNTVDIFSLGIQISAIVFERIDPDNDGDFDEHNLVSGLDTSYLGRLVIFPTHLANPPVPLGRRVAVPSLRVTIDGGTNAVTACGADDSSASVCASLGGIFNAGWTPQCQIGLQDVSCAGAHDIITGFNPDGTPICTDVLQTAPYGHVAVGISDTNITWELVTDWEYGPWGPCSVDNVSSRYVACVRSIDGAAMPDASFCRGTEPVATAECL